MACSCSTQLYKMFFEVSPNIVPQPLVELVRARNAVKDGVARGYHSIAQRSFQGVCDVAPLGVLLQIVSFQKKRTEGDEVEPLAGVKVDAVLV